MFGNKTTQVGMVVVLVVSLLVGLLGPGLALAQGGKSSEVGKGWTGPGAEVKDTQPGMVVRVRDLRGIVSGLIDRVSQDVPALDALLDDLRVAPAGQAEMAGTPATAGTPAKALLNLRSESTTWLERLLMLWKNLTLDLAADKGH